MFKKTFIPTFIAFAVGLSSYASACTRAVYLGNNQHIITARSMDWKVDTAQIYGFYRVVLLVMEVQDQIQLNGLLNMAALLQQVMKSLRPTG